jgi:hypothetical protein
VKGGGSVMGIVGLVDMREHVGESEFAFGVDDPSWDAHLEVAGCDETGPKDGHDVAWGVFVVADEFGAVPKGLDEHGHHDELCGAGGETPEATKIGGGALDILAQEPGESPQHPLSNTCHPHVHNLPKAPKNTPSKRADRSCFRQLH